MPARLDISALFEEPLGGRHPGELTKLTDEVGVIVVATADSRVSQVQLLTGRSSRGNL